MLTVMCAAISYAQIGVTVTNPTNTTPNLAASYTSLTNALNALNATTAMTGPVTFTLAAGSSETAPPTGLTIGSATLNPVLSATNTITIVKSGGTVTLNAGVGTATPASAAPDGILKLTGADHITIDGLTFTDGNITNPATMEFGIGLFKLSANDGCNNNTIRNCIFNMQRVNNAAAAGPMFEGSVAIAAVNATATAAVTALTPTNGGTLATNGTNSGNKFYSNTTNGGNIGIGISGFAATAGAGPAPVATTFLGDLGNDVGGNAVSTGNTILNFGGGGITSASAGVRGNFQWSLNVQFNNINNNNGSGVNHAAIVRGIYAQNGVSANVTISNNTITINGGGTTSAAYGIDNSIGSTAAANTVNINNNLIQNCTYSTATSATLFSISTSATAATVNTNSNQVINNTVGQAGTATSCVFYGIYNQSASTNFNATSNTISGNVVANNFGILYCFRASTSTVTINGNTLSNNIIPNNTGASTSSIYGYYNLSSPVIETITNNDINNFSITGSGTSTANNIYGMYNITASGPKIFSGNNINNFNYTSSGVGAATVIGIRNAYNSTAEIFRNVVHSLSSTGTTPTVSGIYLGSSIATTFNCYNNLIGNLSTPQSTGFNLTGIFCGTVGTNINLYYNTVYLNGTSTGTGFASSAVFMSSTTPSVTMINNILVNLSTSTGTGLSTAVRRTSAVLTSYNTASNNNLFYTGTPSAANPLYFDGTTAYQTLASFKTFVSPRESLSVTEAVSSTPGVFFQSLTGPATGTATNFLHLVNGLTTQAESGGIPVSGITIDYDGNARNVSTPDIGADEFNGVAVDLNPPTITYTPLSQSIVGASITTSSFATITDPSGINTSIGTRPRLYFKKSGDANTFAGNTSGNNGWKFVEADNATSPFDFTINYSLLQSPVIAGDVIQYFVVAQDLASSPNVGINSGNFTATPSSVNLTSAAFPITGTINSYLITTLLTGPVTVCPSGCDYTSLTNPGGVFETINSRVLGSNLIVNILGDLTTETGVNALNAYSEQAPGNYTITLKPGGGARIVSGSIATNALIRTNGASRFMIDGSLSGGTDRSLTIENISTTSPQVVRFGSATTTPVTALTIKNTIIRNGANTSSAIVVLDNTGSAAYTNNVTIQNNDIRRAFIAIFTNHVVAPGNGSGLLITQNKIDNTGADAIRLVGVYVQGADGATVSNNTVGNFNATDSENDHGIWMATGASNTIVSGNTVADINYSGTGSNAPFGIRESSGLTASGNNISGNTVSNITTSGTVAVYGIEASGGGTIIQKNNVQGIINNSTSTYGAYGINVTAGNNNVIKNNFVSNISQNMTGGFSFSTTFGVFGIRIAAGTGHQVYHNSVNMYGALSGTSNSGLLSAAFALVSSVSTGCDVRNNIFANNITGGTTSVAQVSAYLPSFATSSMNLTWNNNAYYYGTDVARQGAGQAGTSAGTNFYSSLAALTAYSSTLSAVGTNDNASIAFTSAVPFLSNNNLHISTSPAIGCAVNNAGAALPSVTDDIDNETRNVTTPDLGADEFNITGDAVATPASQTVCSGAAISTIVFSGTASSYTWTRDNPAITGTIANSGSGNVSGTLVNSGSTPVTVTFTITPVYPVGCAGTIIMASVIVTPENTITLTSPAGTNAQSICIGSSINNISYSTTGATGATFSGLPAGVSGSWVANVVTISGTPTVTGPFPYTVTLTGGCGTVSASGTINVNEPAVINSTLVQPTTCVSNDGSITMTLSGAAGPYTFTWTGTGVTPGAQNQTGLSVGNYSVTVTAANTCSSTSNFILSGPGGCSNCPVIGGLSANPAAGSCSGSTNTFTASGLVDMGNTYGITFKQSTVALANPYIGGTVISTVPNSGLTSGGTVATTTASLTAGTYFIYAILTPTPVDISCRPSATINYTVNPTPVVNQPTSQSLCAGASTTVVTFTGTGADTYTWTNNTPAIGLAASGTGNIPAFTTTNTGSTPLVATITVTPSGTTGGVMCMGAATTFTITVNPVPVVDQPASQVVCNNTSTTAVAFTGTTNTVFNWTNSNATIGLGASGTGNIPSFTATNTGNAPVSGTITVTPSFAGAGPVTTTFSNTGLIEVPATPTTSGPANPYPSNIVVSGVGGPISKVTVSLTNMNHTFPADIDILLVGPGGQNVVIMSDAGGGTDLVGTNLTFDDAATGNLPTTAISSGTYQPTNIGTTADPFAAPAPAVSTPIGNVPLSIFNGTTANGTWSLYIMDDAGGDLGNFAGGWSLSITAAAASACPGTPRTFSYTVNPTPVVNAVNNQVVCNNASTTAVNFSSPTTGGTLSYNWTNSNTSIGLAAGGTGNIPSFTAVNAGTTPMIATITVQATYTNAGVTCSSTSSTFTITVNPTPTVAQPADQTVCVGTMTAPVTFTSTEPGTIFEWTNNNTATGLAASGTGNIAAFTATNTTTAPITSTVTVTPSFGPSGGGFQPELLYYKFNGTGTSVPNLALTPPAGTATATINGALSQGGTAICDGTLIGSGGSSATNFVNTGWATNLSGTSWTISFKAGNITPGTALNYLFGDNTAGSFRCFANGAAGAGNLILRGPVNDVIIPGGAQLTSRTSTFVYDNVAGNIRGYLDGVLVTTVTQTAPVIAGAGPFKIGGYATSDGMPAGAFLDEFRIYNRALTAAQVQALTGCVTPNLNCSGTPRTFTITVNPALTITCPGNITTTGTTGACTATVNYTSTVIGVPVPTVGYTFTGATISSGTGTGSGSIFNVGVTTVTLTATNSCGTRTCSFTVTVNDAQPPAITSQPVNRIVCEGSTATFSVTATNAVSYQWERFNGTTWVPVTGATTAMLTLNNVTISMNTNNYRVRVIGLCTSVTSGTATLSVTSAPTVSIISSQTLLVPGSGFTLTAITNQAGGTFVWFKNGVVVPGVTGNILSGGRIDDRATYRVTYTNATGCTSTSADFVVGSLQTTEIFVYPNPNRGQFQIRYFNQTNEQATVYIYNSAGQIVYNRQMPTGAMAYSRIDVNLNNMAAGIYIIKLIDGSGKEIGVKRVVKQ